MCRSVPRAMRFRVIGLALAFLWLSPLRAAAETVRVAHPLLAPFTYVQNGKTVGLVADILRAAAAREGIEIVFVPESPAQLQETLSNGSPEAIAPMPIGSPKYDFTTPFVVTGGALFVRAPNSAPAGLAALSGKTVITPKDGPFVAFIAQNFPRVTTVRAAGAAMSDEYAQSLSAVVSGRADAAALNIQEGARVVAASYAGKITVPTTMFKSFALALAVPKGRHSDLLKRLDAGLALVKADGTLARIEARWTGAQRAPPHS
jgi:ABC-type amino acid transport substrate-binding protein